MKAFFRTTSNQRRTTEEPIIFFCLSSYKCCFFVTDDGKLRTESDSGEFWVLFGGFAPIGKKIPTDDDITLERIPANLYRYYFSIVSFVHGG